MKSLNTPRILISSTKPFVESQAAITPQITQNHPKTILVSADVAGEKASSPIWFAVDQELRYLA